MNGTTCDHCFNPLPETGVIPLHHQVRTTTGPFCRVINLCLTCRFHIWPQRSKNQQWHPSIACGQPVSDPENHPHIAA